MLILIDCNEGENPYFFPQICLVLIAFEFFKNFNNITNKNLQ